MRRSLLSHSLIAASWGLITCTLQVQPAAAIDAKCQDSISRVTTDLVDRVRARIEKLEIRTAEAPSSPYSNARDELLVVLYRATSNSNSSLPSDNIAAPDSLTRTSENVMNSPSLLTEYSTKIIKDCESVARVTFGLNYSGYMRSFSYREGNTVSPDSCISPIRGEYSPPASWGQSYCVD